MEKDTCSFVERINGVTFIVNMKPSDSASQTIEEFFKDLITEKIFSMDKDTI